MNNNYYPSAVFPGQGLESSGNSFVPNQQTAATQGNNGMIPVVDEQSYIENILRLNRGKKARFHITVPGSKEWQDRVFNGIIEQSGRDHIIVSNPETGEWYLILMIYLDFVTFEEPIIYFMDFPLPIA